MLQAAVQSANYGPVVPSRKSTALLSSQTRTSPQWVRLWNMSTFLVESQWATPSLMVKSRSEWAFTMNPALTG